MKTDRGPDHNAEILQRLATARGIPSARSLWSFSLALEPRSGMTP